VCAGHALGGEVERAGVGTLGELGAEPAVADQRLQPVGDRLVVGRVGVEGGVAPDLAQAGDVAEQEGAAGAGRLERGQPERLVPGRRGEDRGPREPVVQLRAPQPAHAGNW
jgi:hypothetical protein